LTLSKIISGKPFYAKYPRCNELEMNRVNIQFGDCTGVVTLNIRGTITTYVPMGQESPQITGGEDCIIVYHGSEDEAPLPSGVG